MARKYAWHAGILLAMNVLWAAGTTIGSLLVIIVSFTAWVSWASRQEDRERGRLRNDVLSGAPGRLLAGMGDSRKEREKGHQMTSSQARHRMQRYTQDNAMQYMINFS